MSNTWPAVCLRIVEPKGVLDGPMINYKFRIRLKPSINAPLVSFLGSLFLPLFTGFSYLLTADGEADYSP
jgi:hypothetical protein